MKYGTKGTMGVDYEQRIDFDRLRKDRMRKVQEALDKTIITNPASPLRHAQGYAATRARKLENIRLTGCC